MSKPSSPTDIPILVNYNHILQFAWTKILESSLNSFSISLSLFFTPCNSRKNWPWLNLNYISFQLQCVMSLTGLPVWLSLETWSPFLPSYSAFCPSCLPFPDVLWTCLSISPHWNLTPNGAYTHLIYICILRTWESTWQQLVLINNFQMQLNEHSCNLCLFVSY